MSNFGSSKDLARCLDTNYLPRTHVCGLSQADGIWVTHVAEQMTGMEIGRRKTGNHWGHQKRAEKSEKMRRKPAPGR